MLQLCQDGDGHTAVATTLQQLFLDDTIIKLGYGMEGDLKAISKALSSSDVPACDRVASYIDVRHMHSHLREQGVRLRPLHGSGLSGAVLPCSMEAQTGLGCSDVFGGGGVATAVIFWPACWQFSACRAARSSLLV